MSLASPFGPLVSRQDVQQAVLATLQEWIISYLAEVERQEQLPARTIPTPGLQDPVNPVSFRGSLDFARYKGDELPMLIVVVQPVGSAERQQQGVYLQWYESQVAAIVQDADQEILAEQLADWYGKALLGLLTQQGALGTRTDPVEGLVPFSIKTVLASSPRTEFPDPTDRKLARSVCTIRTLVPVVDESQGPRVPPLDPYALPAGWPTITSIEIQLQSQDTLGNISPPAGATVTDPTGHVTVTE